MTTSTPTLLHSNVRLALEGNIGAGKTFLSRTFRDAAADPSSSVVSIAFEKVHRAPLSLFYGNPKKYAYALQLSKLTERLRDAEFSEQRAPTVIDRSLLGDFIFCLANVLLGSISPAEFASYMITGFAVALRTYNLVYAEERDEALDFDVLGQRLLTTPLLFRVVLATLGTRRPGALSPPFTHVAFVCHPPEDCRKRVQVREKSPVEANIPIDYLELLDDLHFAAMLELASMRSKGETALEMLVVTDNITAPYSSLLDLLERHKAPLPLPRRFDQDNDEVEAVEMVERRLSPTNPLLAGRQFVEQQDYCDSLELRFYTQETKTRVARAWQERRSIRCGV